MIGSEYIKLHELYLELRAERDYYRDALQRIAVMSRAAAIDDPLFVWEVAREALAVKTRLIHEIGLAFGRRK